MFYQPHVLYLIWSLDLVRTVRTVRGTVGCNRAISGCIGTLISLAYKCVKVYWPRRRALRVPLGVPWRICNSNALKSLREFSSPERLGRRGTASTLKTEVKTWLGRALTSVLVQIIKKVRSYMLWNVKYKVTMINIVDWTGLAMGMSRSTASFLW